MSLPCDSGTEKAPATAFIVFCLAFISERYLSIDYSQSFMLIDQLP